MFLLEASSLSQLGTCGACHGFHSKSLAFLAESPISLQMTEQTPQPGAQGRACGLPSNTAPQTPKGPEQTALSGDQEKLPSSQRLGLCSWSLASPPLDCVLCLNPSTFPSSCAIRFSRPWLRSDVLIIARTPVQCKMFTRRPSVQSPATGRQKSRQVGRNEPTNQQTNKHPMHAGRSVGLDNSSYCPLTQMEGDTSPPGLFTHCFLCLETSSFLFQPPTPIWVSGLSQEDILSRETFWMPLSPPQVTGPFMV